MEQLADSPTAHDGAHLDTPDALQRENFSISDLTGEFGVTARALRFYEDEGLIAPARVGLNRVYSKRDRARLAWILRAKNVGFSLTEIKEMIDTLKWLSEKQKVRDIVEGDIDIFLKYEKYDKVYFILMQVRRSQIIGVFRHEVSP